MKHQSNDDFFAILRTSVDLLAVQDGLQHSRSLNSLRKALQRHQVLA